MNTKDEKDAAEAQFREVHGVIAGKTEITDEAIPTRRGERDFPPILQERSERQQVPSVGPDRMLTYFRYEHLPERLQAVSRPWCELAQHVVDTLPASAERTVALRKLLEGKDAAVRAALDVGTITK